MCEESCSHRVTVKKGGTCLSFALCKELQRKELDVSVGRSKLDTVLILFNAMQFNAMKTKFHYRGSAFVADIFGSPVEKRLEFSLLPYTYVKLSYGTQWTYGFEIILVFCFFVFSLGSQQ